MSIITPIHWLDDATNLYPQKGRNILANEKGTATVGNPEYDSYKIISQASVWHTTGGAEHKQKWWWEAEVTTGATSVTDYFLRQQLDSGAIVDVFDISSGGSWIIDSSYPLSLQSGNILVGAGDTAFQINPNKSGTGSAVAFTMENTQTLGAGDLLASFKNNGTPKFTIAYDGSIDSEGTGSFLLTAGQKFLIDAATTAHTDTNGALDINLASATNGVSGIDLNVTSNGLTTNGDILMGLSVTPNGHATDIGDGAGAPSLLVAYNANDFTANGGGAYAAGFNVGLNYAIALRLESGQIYWSNVAGVITASNDGADGAGKNITISAGNAYDSGAVSRIGGKLGLYGGAGANGGAVGYVYVDSSGSPSPTQTLTQSSLYIAGLLETGGAGYIGGNLQIGAGGAGVDYTLTFNGETTDGVLTWMEDEDYFSFGDAVRLPASTTSVASLNVQAGTAPTSPAEGDVWNDSTKKDLVGFLSGIKQALSSSIFIQTASATAGNTTDETTLIGSGTGTLTLPANFFTVGKTIRVKARGYYSEVSSPNMQIRLKLGSTAVYDTGTVSIGDASTGTQAWKFEADITCRTTGGTGTTMTQGMFGWITGATTTHVFADANTATDTIDTTGTLAIGLTMLWGTADASNTITCTNLTIEVINPST